MIRHAFAAALLLALPSASTAIDQAPTEGTQGSLAAAIAADTRTPANVQRDRYRHPAETLAFFGVGPTDTVVEIWPGGGWYTEILAPWLGPRGVYYATAISENGHRQLREMTARRPDLYGRIRFATFPVFDGAGGGVPDGTADVVLTFRNVHNWRMGSGRNRQDYTAEAFRQMFRMLKPGGTLGIVEHRLPEDADAAREASSGYMKVSTIRRLAEEAGFRFVAASEINANPLDSHDWPEGVWTLPPTLRLGAADRERYLAVGESDRMTLRFEKPRS
jgi:predicted methyltransferase